MLRSPLEPLGGRGTVVTHVAGHLVYGDAVSNDARAKWDLLREVGVPGNLYAAVRDSHFQGLAQPLEAHRAAADELIVFHYSGWSPAAEYVLGLPRARLLLVWHNITPSEWFAGLNQQAERDTRIGRERLADFLPKSAYAVADSEYSRRELAGLGFPETAVVPILIDFDSHGARLSRAPARPRNDEVRVLTVGRLAPNKRVEDTIALFRHYNLAVNPRSRLTVLGPPIEGAYPAWVRELPRRLGIGSSVEFTGHVSDDDVARHYAWSDAYVTMSEHEGFCVPPLEAMAVGMPVLAFDSTAVPFTVGDAAVLMRRKDPAVGAELLDQLVRDTPLRRRLVAKGRERVQEFARDRTRDHFLAAIDRALALSPPGAAA
jgi:glycosyltransferase involved in cell wall biosynthesis